ncbi:MAG TPA: hypothetical protein VFH72_11225 [Candidatus Baltobacteraceae bacterium]|nr:hypothetical protein [Candidatus Baltobacteraceae bacterium]
MIRKDSTLDDVAFAVAQALEAKGILSVLTGGSAAAIYAPNRYMSDDADFILDNDESLDDVAAALEPIGFKRDGKSRIFHHSDSRYTVDFPKGPLAAGGEYVKATETLVQGGRRLRILTRFDCVRDRLAHFYYWSDYTALNAAVAVAADLSEADVARVRSWTERESSNLTEKFGEFARRLQKAREEKKERPR